MGGTVVIIIVLAIFPVLMLMTMAGLAAGLGQFLKLTVDAEHEDSELLAVSEAPY